MIVTLLLEKLPGLAMWKSSTAHRSTDDFAKHHMPSIQPGGLDSGDEKLGSIGVLAGISHANPEGTFVLQLEVLILKFVPINTFAYVLRKLECIFLIATLHY